MQDPLIGHQQLHICADILVRLTHTGAYSLITQSYDATPGKKSNVAARGVMAMVDDLMSKAFITFSLLAANRGWLPQISC